MNEPTRVLFASIDDATDVRAWSGTPYHMYQALVASPADVLLVSPLRERLSLPFKVAQAAHNAFSTRRYSRQREPVILRGYARQIARAAARVRPDVILAPSSIPLALLDSGVPTVIWTDSAYAEMLDYYPSFSNLSTRHREICDRMEAAALQRAALVIYSSDWAAESAVKHYGVPAEKLAVVPFGANLIDPGPRERTTGEGRCKLLTVGTEWHRKGFDLAVATLVELQRLGVDATLDIVGSSPDPAERMPDGVAIHSMLDKGDPAGARRIRELYEQAAFFILPSRADCTPIVLAEAAAYGLPVVASATGGMAAMLRPGRSGHLVDLADFAVTAAGLLASCWRDPVAYHQMAAESRLFYEERVNWGSAIGALLDVVDQRLLSRRA